MRFTVEREPEDTEYGRQFHQQGEPYAVIIAGIGRRVRHYPTFEEAMQEAKRRNEEIRKAKEEGKDA